MPADVAPLREQLDRLESALRRAGCPNLPPGLTPGEVDRLSAPFPLPLPSEAVTFFTWHNGFGIWVTPMPHAPVSLEVSVQRSLDKRAEVEEVAPGQGWDPDVIWPRSWFIFGISHDTGFVIDCAESGGEIKPVLHPMITWSGTDDPHPADHPQVVAPSLTSVVSEWARLFEAGAYDWDPSRRVPVRIDERMPDDSWHRAYF